MQVKIYRPSKTAMQSGQAKTHQWVLEAVPQHRKDPENLMGWVSSKDTLSEIRLKFPTQAEAVAYAEQQGWTYTIAPAHNKTIRPKNYSDNFQFRKTS